MIKRDKRQRSAIPNLPAKYAIGEKLPVKLNGISVNIIMTGLAWSVSYF